MATQNVTDYERKRLENIRRNQERIASLNLKSMATQLSASTKRPRAEPKNNSEKQPRTIRRSLRTRGLSPEKKDIARWSGGDRIENVVKTMEYLHHKVNPRKLGPLSMRDVYSGVSDRALIKSILGTQFGKEESLSRKEFEGDLKVESLGLNEKNVAWVVPGNVMNMKFLPSSNLRMVVVGNVAGNVGFWNIDSKEGEDGGIYVYRPHASPISGICVHQDCMSKIFTSSYDTYNGGFIRSMDAEKEVFDLVYASDKAIYSLAQQSNNAKCVYFAEGNGGISMWDERTGNISAQWSLHHGRINSIDFNSENSNIMATSSADQTACIWDLRCNDADKLKSLKTIGHERVVYSAYFSPSGRLLVTTSLDNTVGISSGVNFEDDSMIHHENNTGFMFKAIWGWDDAHVFIGNKNRGVDVISPLQRRTILTMQSPYVSAVPARLAAHPYNVGMLAGATGRGQVCVWTVG